MLILQINLCLLYTSRTFAETSSYELFKELLKKTNYRKIIWKVLFIGNLKLSLLTGALLVSPRLFVNVIKQKKKIDEKEV